MGHFGKLRYRRECAECGIRFRATRRHARFCSSACRARSHRTERSTDAPPKTRLRLVLERNDALLIHDLLTEHGTDDLPDRIYDAYVRVQEAIEAADS